MAVQDVLQQVALAGGALLGVGTMWKATRGAYRAVRRVESIYHAVNRELLPNGGGSMKDALGRIDTTVKQHGRDIVALKSAVGVERK